MNKIIIGLILTAATIGVVLVVKALEKPKKDFEPKNKEEDQSKNMFV
jgi:hypothetical protein